MKHKTKYVIRTNYGNEYETDKLGRVLKYSNGLDKTNSSSKELDTWKIRGLHEIKPFNNLSSLIQLEEASKIKDFRFKNGYSKYVIADTDHNTQRIHGNWRVHGVISVNMIS